MYTLLSLSTFFSVIHGIFLYGLENLNERMSLSYFIGLGLLNFTGDAIYATRIPERWYPKRDSISGAVAIS
jgi:adiponectin receptor